MSQLHGEVESLRKLCKLEQHDAKTMNPVNNTHVPNEKAKELQCGPKYREGKMELFKQNNDCKDRYKTAQKAAEERKSKWAKATATTEMQINKCLFFTS